MLHKFKISDLVRIRTSAALSGPRGVCEVTRLLPPGIDGEPLYYVKSVQDGLTRAILEHQLTKATAAA